MTVRFWLLIPFAVPSWATPVIAVTEEEFLRSVEETHPAFVETQGELAVAEADFSRAKTWPNPAIDLEQEALQEGPKQTTLSASWVIPFDGRRGLDSEAAKTHMESVRQDRRAVSLELRGQARGAYARWALAVVRQKASDSLLAKVNRLASQSTARARVGEESGLTARRLALAALEVRAAAARAAAEVANARAQAKAWVPALPTDADPQRPELPPAPISSLVSGNPSLEARRLEIERFELELRLSKRFWEAPELSFGWQRIEDETASIDGPVFGISWSLPLFDRRQADRIEARGQLAAARARLELAERLSQAELEGALAAYVQLREAAGEADRLVGESTQVIESAAARFRLGESTLTDLLETLRTVLAASETAVTLYADALEAHRALERAAGRPLSANEESR